MISTLQHPNLVKLFGCCTNDDQLLLIYEYMENNSLGRALFGTTSTIFIINVLIYSCNFIHLNPLSLIQALRERDWSLIGLQGMQFA